LSREKPTSEPSPAVIIGFGLLLFAGGIGLAGFVIWQAFLAGAARPNNLGDWLGAIFLIALGTALVAVGGAMTWSGIFEPPQQKGAKMAESSFEEQCQAAERELGFPVPQHYLETLKKLQLQLGAAALNPESGIGIDENIAGGAAATPLDVVSVHGSCEAAAECVEEEFTEWLSDYVAIADDGGGGFYFVRKDAQGGVYLMDSDWMEEPREVSPNVEAFLNKAMENDWPE